MQIERNPTQAEIPNALSTYITIRVRDSGAWVELKFRSAHLKEARRVVEQLQKELDKITDNPE